MGEWKTAWDHIVFEGFLGVRMKLQFTWEGCDSALAAPLLLDLIAPARAGARARRARRVAELAFFFKDPAGTQRARAAPPVRDAGALGAPEGRCVTFPRRRTWPSWSGCRRC